MLPEFKSIFDLLKAFPTEQDCINHLEKIRWNGVIVSPFDETSKVYKCANNKYKCKNTGKYFNVRTNTIFDNTKIPLQKWFLALYVFSSHKKGISSHQLAKDISVTQKSAWFLLHRLRYAFEHPNFKAVIGEDNGVEIDETFIGGKNKNRHKDKKVENSQGRSCIDKTPVLGMLERTESITVERPHKVIKGKMVSEKVVLKRSVVICQVVANTKQETVKPIINTTITKGASVYTDEWSAYNNLHKNFNHERVNHGAKEFVNGMAYTNNLEGFWSHLKRGIDGIYHWVSKDHLQSYVNEFTLRYNTRSQTTQNRFDLVLSSVAGKRLTYESLIK
jgi:transposase-like protein